MMSLTTAQHPAGTKADFYWEDFTAGQVLEFGRSELSREDIIEFACRYDPQPFHIDEHAAQSTILEGLAASGWHVCTVFMGMLQDGLLSRCQGAELSAIDEIKWRIPVRPRDQLRCRATCMETKSCAKRHGFGICTFYCEALNASGDPVMSWRFELELQSARSVRLGDAVSMGETKATGSRVTRLPGDHEITFFEDVCIGNEIELGSHVFTSDSIAVFNNDYGTPPIQPDAGSERLSASGWHVTAVWMRQLVRYYMRKAEQARTGGLSVPRLGPSPGIKKLRWHRPVYAGDRLTFSSWAERKMAVRSKPDWGLLLSGIDVRNQHKACVASFYAMLLLERRARA